MFKGGKVLGKYKWYNVVTTCTIGAGFGVGWWYRPIADESKDGNGPVRNGFMSQYSLADIADENKPPLYELASTITLLTTMAIARTFLFYLGECKIKNDENYTNFLHCVVSREKGRPLITVSNHRSLIDDPAVMSAILPIQLAIFPEYNRYSICSQEYLFASKVCIVYSIIGLYLKYSIYYYSTVYYTMLFTIIYYAVLIYILF